MIYYFDASGLVKAFFYETGSKTVINILNSGFPVYSSLVAYPEVLFALKRKRYQQEISEDNFQQGLTKFEEKWDFFNVIELSSVLRLLKDRVIKYPLKSLDAIHLASALWIKENISDKLSIVCSDKELLMFCEKEGLTVINPEEME